MKNRLIYGLIALMLVSLLGIIWIQTGWINDAIAERERQFEVHINNALNAVNESIDTDEAELILQRQLGSVDSLVNGMVMMKTEDGHLTVNIGEHDVSVQNERSESNDKEENNFFERRIEIRTSEKRGGATQTDELVWEENADKDRVRFDSLKELHELTRHRIQNIESVVEHYTVELLLSGELKNRLNAKSLKEKLATALHQEGIQGDFAFAVKNLKTNKWEEDFVSDGFERSGTSLQYEKKLFPDDRLSATTYSLILQPQDRGNHVWSKVWKMAVLSVIFTVLILLSFGYALYFIFKQKKISQVKNDFINNMTHELKTPLASISLAVSSINHAEVITNPEEIKRLTEIIGAEKERMNQHIERVLDTAALDAGEMSLKFERVDVRELIRRAMENVDLALRSVNGSWDLQADESVLIAGDTFHLINVFTTIMDNSIKYRSEAPLNIKIRISVRNATCVITFSDNGIGMSSREQRLAFDAFYRAETGDVHNRKGFGLGLSYAKGVIEKHKGSIALSGKKGEGTTVEVQLPMYGG